MMDVAYEIEPPDIAVDDGDSDQRTIYLYLSINEPDGTGRQASTFLPADGLTDFELAEALITCLYGLATMRGSGLAIEISRRLRRIDSET